MKKIAHIIAAAGTGSRYGAPLPKQFCNLGGRPLLITTIERMRKASDPSEAMIILSMSPAMVDEWLDMCIEHGFRSPAIVEGGATRWESVRNALQAVPPGVEVVTVHDGARPVVTRDIVDEVVTAVLAGRQGALPVVALTDSVRRVVADDGTSQALDRSILRAVQTPQAFNARLLRRAYERPYSPLFTDDASVMEAAGYTDLALVAGDARNIKVTHPGDIEIAALYLSSLT